MSYCGLGTKLQNVWSQNFCIGPYFILFVFYINPRRNLFILRSSPLNFVSYRCESGCTWVLAGHLFIHHPWYIFIWDLCMSAYSLWDWHWQVIYTHGFDLRVNSHGKKRSSLREIKDKSGLARSSQRAASNCPRSSRIVMDIRIVRSSTKEGHVGRDCQVTRLPN